MVSEAISDVAETRVRRRESGIVAKTFPAINIFSADIMLWPAAGQCVV